MYSNITFESEHIRILSMMRAVRISSNIFLPCGLKRTPVILCTPSSSTFSSLLHSQTTRSRTTHRFIFKRLASTDQPQNNPSQNNSQGFCDEFKSIKNPSTEQIAGLVKKYNIVPMGPITGSSQTISSLEEHKQHDEPSWTTKLSRSYVLPFTVMSGTFGFALTYVSDNPVFILCSIPLGICGGMLRDKNKKIQNDNYLSAGIKIVSIYVLGPSILLGGIGLVAMMALKQ